MGPSITSYNPRIRCEYTVSDDHLTISPERGIYCNRTLNLRAIRAIGYDMDYTLVHYKIHEWERTAYHYLKEKLLALGWPIHEVEFDADLVVRGLVIDLEHGNLLKANRFGYVKRAYHGTHPIPFDRQRELYGRALVDLAEDRWVFLNTLFSLSEACMYSQLVDLLDTGAIPGVLGYQDLHRCVRESIDETHLEGDLKAKVIADPDRYVELDPDVPQMLLDQRAAGKRLMLITNSEWEYANAMMTYAFDRYLPDDMTWRDLFDLKIVSARKPAFFFHRNPIFQVTVDSGLLRPVPMGIEGDGVYLGGNARMVESYLGLSGDEILYVGDHMYADVHVTKDVLRWRTALVLHELDAELRAMRGFEKDQERLGRLMHDKNRLEFDSYQIRLALLRARANSGKAGRRKLEKRLGDIRAQVATLDEEIAPLATASSRLSNERWGLLMRAGNDKSYLARQVERYADIYMSRVSNFLLHTPFVYLRSPRGTLPHDMSIVSSTDEDEHP